MATPIKKIILTDQNVAGDAPEMLALLLNTDGTTFTPGAVADGSISEAQLAEGAVATKNIQDDAVAESKIAPNAVVTAAIKDGSVTAAKLAAGVLPAAATRSALGTVKQAATLNALAADANLATVVTTVNNLIAQLKAAGIMANSAS